MIKRMGFLFFLLCLCNIEIVLIIKSSHYVERGRRLNCLQILEIHRQNSTRDKLIIGE